MTRRIYVDTNIFLDFWFDRSTDSGGIVPAGYFAGELFVRVIGCEFLVVISNITTNELRKHYSADELDRRLHTFGKKLLIVNATEDMYRIAWKIAKERRLPHADVLHALICRKSDSECIVTRDFHFVELENIVAVKKPEEVL